MRSEDPRLTELRSLGARIGTGIYLGPEVYFEKDFAELLTIEDDVVLSQGATVLLHDSSLNNLVGAPIRFGAVTLRRRCYIGANSLVMGGVTVGAGALVGAAALVNVDVPDGAVVYGVPARVTGTVAELVERSAADERSDRFFSVDGAAWRDRSLADDATLGEDIAAAFAEWRAHRSAAPRDDSSVPARSSERGGTGSETP